MLVVGVRVHPVVEAGEPEPKREIKFDRRGVVRARLDPQRPKLTRARELDGGLDQRPASPRASMLAVNREVADLGGVRPLREEDHQQANRPAPDPLEKKSLDARHSATPPT